MAVHNTVTVDNRDPCVFWGAFRVAYPPAAKLIDGSESYLLGEHRGYLRSSSVLHRRRVERREESGWKIIDSFRGEGEHQFQLTLQLAPEAVTRLDGLEGVVHWPDGSGLRIRPLDLPAGITANFVKGSVAAGWNQLRAAPRYELRWRSVLPSETRLLLAVTSR